MKFCLDDALKLDYLNGLLSDEDRHRFEEHLAACPACRKEIAGLRNTIAAFAGLTPPPVPAAWTSALEARLRAERPSSRLSLSLAGFTPARRRTNVFLYGGIALVVTASLVLLFGLITGGTVERWLPGLSTAALGISDPRVARTVILVTWILSLHALMLVPSIIDNVYQLVRRRGRRTRPGRSVGHLAC